MHVPPKGPCRWLWQPLLQQHRYACLQDATGNARGRAFERPLRKDRCPTCVRHCDQNRKRHMMRSNVHKGRSIVCRLMSFADTSAFGCDEVAARGKGAHRRGSVRLGLRGFVRRTACGHCASVLPVLLTRVKGKTVCYRHKARRHKFPYPDHTGRLFFRRPASRIRRCVIKTIGFGRFKRGHSYRKHKIS